MGLFHCHVSNVWFQSKNDSSKDLCNQSHQNVRMSALSHRHPLRGSHTSSRAPERKNMCETKEVKIYSVMMCHGENLQTMAVFLRRSSSHPTFGNMVHGSLSWAKASESCRMELLLLAKTIKPPVGASKRCAGRAWTRGREAGEVQGLWIRNLVETWKKMMKNYVLKTCSTKFANVKREASKFRVFEWLWSSIYCTIWLTQGQLSSVENVLIMVIVRCNCNGLWGCPACIMTISHTYYYLYIYIGSTTSHAYQQTTADLYPLCIPYVFAGHWTLHPSGRAPCWGHQMPGLAPAVPTTRTWRSCLPQLEDTNEITMMFIGNRGKTNYIWRCPKWGYLQIVQH